MDDESIRAVLEAMELMASRYVKAGYAPHAEVAESARETAG